MGEVNIPATEAVGAVEDDDLEGCAWTVRYRSAGRTIAGRGAPWKTCRVCQDRCDAAIGRVPGCGLDRPMTWSWAAGLWPAKRRETMMR